ncbi:MAG: DUF481 domain-containing protein [Gemmatimonadota bacterium]
MTLAHPPLRVLLSGLLAVLFLPSLAAAQEDEEVTRDWTIELELGGTLYFGNRQQSQVSTRTEIGMSDTAVEIASDLRFTYGVSTDSDGVTEVNRRSWIADNTLDFRPGAQWRPFLAARVESALERRIDRRYQAGTGIKYDNQVNRNNRTEFSLAILAERTRRRVTSGSPPEEGDVGRLSSELRIRRTFFEDRLGIDFQNAYRPVFDELGNFIVSTRNSLTFSLTEVVGLRFAFRTEFDSGAKDRGAETNYDGDVQVSIAVEF